MKFSPLYPKLFLDDDGEVYAYGVRRLTQCLEGGYLLVTYKNTSYRVHRVVASIHCPGYAPGLVVDHVDGNRLNNDPKNLNWVTPGENTKRAWETGLVDNAGENHGLAKLTDAIVMDIRESFSAGESQQSIADRLGVSSKTISKVVLGQMWKHLPRVAASGFKPRVMTPQILTKALSITSERRQSTPPPENLGLTAVHYTRLFVLTGLNLKKRNHEV